MRTDGQTDKTQLTVAFRNAENAPKKHERLTHSCVMLGTAQGNHNFRDPMKDYRALRYTGSRPVHISITFCASSLFYKTQTVTTDLPVTF